MNNFLRGFFDAVESVKNRLGSAEFEKTSEDSSVGEYLSKGDVFAELRKSKDAPKSFDIGDPADRGRTAYTTPRIARRVVYGSELGRDGKFDQYSASNFADEDSARAQRVRFEDLKRAGRLDPDAEFDASINYPILLPSTFSMNTPDKVIPDGVQLSGASLDSRIPLVRMYGKPRAYYMPSVARDGNNWTFSGTHVNLGDIFNRGRFADPWYAYVHELGHVATPVAMLGGAADVTSSFWGEGGDDAKVPASGYLVPSAPGVGFAGWPAYTGYATDPAELVNAVLAGKAGSRAHGIDPNDSSAADQWMDSLLEASDDPKLIDKTNDLVDTLKQNKGEFESLPVTSYDEEGRATGYPKRDVMDRIVEAWTDENDKNNKHDYLMNIGSVRAVLRDLRDKAQSQSATDEDKQNYKDFRNTIKYFWPRAQNNNSSVSGSIA